MCKFCESLENWQDIHKFDNAHAPKDEKKKHEYRVALLIYSWCPKHKTKRQASRLADYRSKGLGYKLNYCPECGRRMRCEKDG